MEKLDLEKAWAAGFFDGEGCVYLHHKKTTANKYARLQVVQSGIHAKEILCRFQKAIGGLGKVYKKYDASDDLNLQESWVFIISKQLEVKKAINLLFPYLGPAKKEQANKILSKITYVGRKTHCKRGHKFDKENTIIRKLGRECRTCKREHNKKWKQKKQN